MNNKHKTTFVLICVIKWKAQPTPYLLYNESVDFVIAAMYIEVTRFFECKINILMFVTCGCMGVFAVC